MKKTAYENWVAGIQAKNRYQAMMKRTRAERLVHDGTFGGWLGAYCRQQMMRKEAGIWDWTKDTASGIWNDAKNTVTGLAVGGYNAVKGYTKERIKAYKENPLKAVYHDMFTPQRMAYEHVVKPTGQLVADTSKGIYNWYTGKRDIDTSQDRNEIYWHSKKDSPELNELSRVAADASKITDIGVNDLYKARMDYDQIAKDIPNWEQIKNTSYAAPVVLEHFGGDMTRAKEFMRLYGLNANKKNDKWRELEQYSNIVRAPLAGFYDKTIGWLPGFIRNRVAGGTASALMGEGIRATTAGNMLADKFPMLDYMLGNADKARSSAANYLGSDTPEGRNVNHAYDVGGLAGELALASATAGAAGAPGFAGKFSGIARSPFLIAGTTFSDMDRTTNGPSFLNSVIPAARDYQLLTSPIPTAKGALGFVYDHADDVVLPVLEQGAEHAAVNLRAAHPEIFGMTTRPMTGDEQLRDFEQYKAQLEQAAGQPIDDESAYHFYERRYTKALEEDIAAHEDGGPVDVAYRNRAISKMVTSAQNIPQEFWASETFRSLPPEQRQALYEKRLKFAFSQDYFNGQQGSKFHQFLGLAKSALSGEDMMAKFVQASAGRGSASFGMRELNSMLPSMLNDQIDQASIAAINGEQPNTKGAGQAFKFLDAVCEYGDPAQLEGAFTAMADCSDQRLAKLLELTAASGSGMMDNPELKKLCANPKFRANFMEYVVAPKLQDNESVAMLLPPLVKMMQTGTQLDPAYDGMKQDMINLVMQKDDWDVVFQNIAEKRPEDLSKMAEVMSAMEAQGLDPKTVAMCGGQENIDAFKQKFMQQAKSGAFKAALKDPTSWHKFAGMWLQSQGMGGLGKFFSEHPFAFWAIVLGILGLGVVGISSLLGDDEEEKEPDRRSLPDAETYVRGIYR